MCFGLRSLAGTNPGTGLSPIIPGGNCIVIAAPLNKCKDDGSEGDVSGNGPGSGAANSGSGSNSYLNSEECKKPTEKLNKDDKQQLIAFARGTNFDREQLRKRLSSFAGNMQSSSLLNIGGDESS
jgi:hypothetical protein